MAGSMPKERKSLTHRFKVGDLKGYITAGVYDDGSLGEIFLTADKQGTFERGLLHSLALMISMALQSGISVQRIVEKLKGCHFEPSGFTKNPDIPSTSSIVDYIARWIELKFVVQKRRNE